VML
jgi:hypothetical protein